MGKKRCAVLLTVILLGVIAFGGVGATSLNGTTVTEQMYGMSLMPLSVRTVMDEMYGSQNALLYQMPRSTTSTSDGTEEENVELSEISGDWLPLDSGAISTPQHADNKAILLDGTYANLELSTYVKVDRNDAKSDAGLFFRASNVGEGENDFTGYYVGLDAYRDKLVFGRVNNDWTNLATIDIVINAGQYYELKVEATGNTFKLYVDGLLKRTVTDTNPILSVGSAGLRASNTAATFISPQCNGIYALQSVSGTWSTGTTLPTYTVSQGADSKAIITGCNYADVDFTSYVYVGRDDASSDAGVFFRATNVGTGTNAFTGYYVGIDASRDWLLLGRVNNAWSGLRTVNTPIVANQYYKLRVKALGNRIQVYLDGVKVIDVADMNNPILTAGALGFRANQTYAKFKNAKVHNLPQMTPEVFNDHTLNTTCGTWTVGNTDPKVYSATQGSDDKTVLNGVSYANLKLKTYMKIGRDDAASDAGIIFRASNIGTGANALKGYYVGMDASQDKLWVARLNNNWTGLKTVSMTINKNEYYKITIEAQGNNIKVYVNDALKANVTDSSPILTAGAVGFRANKTAAWYTRLQHEDITYSDDASLSALTVEEHELSPAFDPDITEYQVSVSKYTRNINITATPADEAATVSDTDTASNVTGMKVFNKYVSLGNNTFDFLVKAEDGTEKTYTVKIKRGRVAYVNNYFDNGYLRNYGYFSNNQAINRINSLIDMANNIFLGFGLKIEATTQYGETIIDSCESASPTNICTEPTHDPSCTDRAVLIGDAFDRYPYIEPYTTDAIWSGYRIQSLSGRPDNSYDYNRSCSYRNKIFMLGQSTDMNGAAGTLVHEMSHQFGIPDHYHEYLINGSCAGGIHCWYPECNPTDEGRDPWPQNCMMANLESSVDIATSYAAEVYCYGCRNLLEGELESRGY